jgi:hypothetical protein
LIYELAGIVGVDPGPLTLRELAIMAEARQRAAWNHTSVLLATLVNINRDPKKGRAAKPADFNPFAERPKAPSAPPPKADISILKSIFVKGTKT